MCKRQRASHHISSPPSIPPPKPTPTPWLQQKYLVKSEHNIYGCMRLDYIHTSPLLPHLPNSASWTTSQAHQLARHELLQLGFSRWCTRWSRSTTWMHAARLLLLHTQRLETGSASKVHWRSGHCEATWRYKASQLVIEEALPCDTVYLGNIDACTPSLSKQKYISSLNSAAQAHSNSLASAEVLGEVRAQHSWSPSKRASSRKWRFTWKKDWQAWGNVDWLTVNDDSSEFGKGTEHFQSSSLEMMLPTKWKIIQNSLLKFLAANRGPP